VDPHIFSQKLAKIVGRTLSDFASEADESSVTALSDAKLHSLTTILNASSVVNDDATSLKKLELSDDALKHLEKADKALMSKDATIAWKLRAFLMRQSADRLSIPYFCALLDQAGCSVDEYLIHGCVDAYVQKKDRYFRGGLLGELMNRDKLIGGPIGPLVAARRLLDVYQGTFVQPVTCKNVSNGYSGPNVNSASTTIEGGLDLAKIHAQLTSHLSQTESLPHFKQISEIMLLLLDKHAHAMSQFNVEATLASVVEVCSARGPKIQGPKAAGEIFAALFKLVALIIKRHRLRLSGHFHILLATLRALLNIVLADPTISASSHRSAKPHLPLWLHTRLQPRHAERFARLLTLVCEPSAASVARSRSRSELDSATDAAKRVAGQYMYLILEVYVKLQLEVGVSREMRKALEVGIYSVLGITSEGCRRVLNESLDAGGRALFKVLFAEYRKSGKWKGV
jgi:hypothetical protein